MKNKLMIITYNDNGMCYIQNYRDGEINITSEGESVLNRDGWCMAVKNKHTNIEIKKLRKHNLTLSELNDIINYLTGLRDKEKNAESNTL